MATISVPSSLQGKSYSVKIAGDTPTPEEQARIGAFVAQQDAQLAKFLPGGSTPTAPENTGPDTSYRGAIRSAFDQPLENLATTSRMLGGNGIADFLSGAVDAPQNYESATTGFMNEDGTFYDFSYLPRAAVEQAGQFVGTVGTRAAGALLGGAAGSVIPGVGNVAGAAVGAFAGPALFEGLQVLGPVAQERAENNGRDAPNADDWLGALKAAGASGAMNAIAPGMSGFLKKVIVEGGTEGLQSVIEQAGGTLGTNVGLQVDLKQAGAEAILGGSAAGIVDAPFAAVRSKSEANKKVAETEAKALADMQEDQEEDAKDVMEKIGFGQKAMEPPVEEEVAQKPVALLPPPVVGQTARQTAQEAPPVAMPTQAVPEATPQLAAPVPPSAGAAPARPAQTFRWKEYQAALQNIGKEKAPTILSIQNAAKSAGTAPITPAVARDIRSQMERDGVIKPSAKVKGGYEYQPNVVPQVDRAESYRRTLEDLNRDAADARAAREKATLDARKAQQTGKAAEARKLMLEVDKADQTLAGIERNMQEVSSRLPQAQREQAVPTAQQPGSRMEGKQAFAPITEAPPAVQSKAVTARSQRLRQAMSYYQDQARRQGVELRRLQADQKKVQLPKSDIKRIEELKASIGQAAQNVQQIGRRLANPTADIEENVAQQKAAAAKEAAAIAERANKTPVYSQKEKQISTALRKRLDNLGLKDVQLFTEKMLKPEEAKRDILYEGLFSAKDGNRMIAVSMGIYDPKMTSQQQFDALSEVMNHEVIHALRNLGLFTDAEWKVLSDLAARQQFMKMRNGKLTQRGYTYLQRAKQMYAQDSAEIQVEEAVAEMFRDYTAGRLKIGGRPKTLMERIKSFFTSIWKSHEDAGMTDPNQIFEGVRFGEIGKRERKAENRVSPVSPNATTTERQSKLEAGREQYEQPAGNVGRRPAGEDEAGQGAGREAVRATSEVLAPRSSHGGTDLGGLTVEDLNELSPAFFDQPGWAILTATHSTRTDAQNEMMHERLKETLVNGNIPYREVYGVYQGVPDGVSYIVLMDEPSAVMLGARFDQDSVLTNRGLIFARAPMPRNIRNEGVVFYGDEARSKDFYSDLGDGRVFSLDMDWSSGPSVADIGPGYYTLPERPQLPIRAADGKVELHHWSNRKLKNVDPKKAGTGPLEGEERRRGAELGFFGINPRPDDRAQGTGYVKEGGLGQREHIALVDPLSLYPYFTDPDNLSDGLDVNGPDFQNEYEERIQEAGYKGYYTERMEGQTPLGKITPFRSPHGNTAAMFFKTPVKPVEEVQLGLRNPTRYSMRRAMTKPLTNAERKLTVLDRMNQQTAEFISDGQRRDVVQALIDLQKPRAKVVITPDSPKAVERVARLMLAELRMALIRSPEAVGWYGTTLAKAKRVAAMLHPEISPVNPYSGATSNSYDPISEHAWDLAMAITSNGMAVSENAKFANEQYEYWKENGKFREEGTGDQGSGMAAAFRVYNAMKDSMTDAQIAAFLSSQMTVRDLKKNPVILSLGIDVGSSEAVDTVINGSYIFGPKIGQGFFQNLRGNFDPLTMDLWFMRMFNRLTGSPFREQKESVLQKNADRVATEANRENLSEYDQRVRKVAMEAENIDIITPENAGRFAIAFNKVYQRDFKKFYDDAVKASGMDAKSREAKEIGKAARPAGSQLVLAAKTFAGNLELSPQDVPRNSSDRSFMRAVVDQVRAVLADEGNNISTADIQAVMWYAEKQLFAAMGVRPGKGGDNDYVDGAIELLRSKGIEDAEISRGLPAAERDRIRYRTASERTAARLRGESGAEPSVETGGGTGAVQGAPIGGGTSQAAGNGSGGVTPRASVRYSTSAITPAVGSKVLTNQKTLMYARASDLIANVLNLKGYGIELTKAREFSDGVLRRFQDSMLPVGRMIQELSQRGMTITDAMDPYLQEELMHGVVGQKIAQNQTTMFEPIMEAVKALNVPKAQIDALVRDTNLASTSGRGFLGLALESYGSPKLALAEAYLYAKHSRERNKFIRENRDEENDTGSGMSDDEAMTILRWFEGLDGPNKTVVQNMARVVRDVVANTNAIRLDGGLISADVVRTDGTAPVEGADYRFYVPLRGSIGEETDDEFAGPPGTPRFGARGREDKKALGRSDYASDILANLFTQNQNAILRAERNKVGQSFLKLLRANTKETGAYARVLPKAPTIRASVDGKIRNVPDPRAADRPDMLVVKEDGREVFVQFNDDRLAGALNGKNGMSPMNANFLTQSMQKVNRYLAAINTSYNPEFIITNVVRDLQTAGVNVSQYEKDGLAKDVISGVKSALVGVKRAVIDNDDSSEWAKVYKDFVEAGGQNSTNMVSSLSDQMSNIQNLLGNISESGARGQWAKVKNSFVGQKTGSLLKMVEDYNTVAENGIRVSTYKALLDRGFTKQRAAQAARNVTVNFSKGGDYRQAMGAWYLFYNASLQGSFAMLNAAVRSPKVRKLWASVIVMGLVQDQLNAMLSGDDDDGEKVYDKIEDYILEHNFILPDPFGFTARGYISIPLPYGLNMAYNAGRATSRALRGGYDAGEATSTIFGTAIDTLNPIGGFESWANFFSPTVADPFIDVIENLDYANKPIFKEGLPFDKTPAPDSQQYWSTTSPSAVWLANTMNDLTGGNAVRPGLIDWSPDIMEFWFDQLTGGVGRFVQNSVETPLSVVSEGFTEETFRSIPFSRKLFGSVSDREDMGAYIEGAKAVLMAGEELKKARETGDVQWARDTIQNYGKELRLLGPIKAMDSALRKVSMQRNQIMANDRIPEDQRRLLLDRLDERKQMILLRANILLKQLE